MKRYQPLTKLMSRMAIFEAPVRFRGGPSGDDRQEEMEHFPREPASLGAFGTLGLDLVAA